jgi:hypothetical protein
MALSPWSRLLLTSEFRLLFTPRAQPLSPSSFSVLPSSFFLLPSFNICYNLHTTQSGEGNPVKKSRKFHLFVERVFAKNRLNGRGGRNIVQPPPEELAAAPKTLDLLQKYKAPHPSPPREFGEGVRLFLFPPEVRGDLRGVNLTFARVLLSVMFEGEKRMGGDKNKE